MPRWQNEYCPRSKVYVGGLPVNATSDEVFWTVKKMHKNSVQLEVAFKRFGKISKVWVAQRSPGFAFIEFEEGRDAEGSFLFVGSIPVTVTSCHTFFCQKMANFCIFYS